MKICRHIYSIFRIFVVFWLSACSTEKNTLVTRTYHHITSKYNIFFNGEESFQRGLKRARESMEYDYTRVLPLFTYGDESVSQSIAPDMERAIKKATKVITLHSITVKPEYKDGPETPRQKRFYRKNEFNKYVDDNYLLLGKAYLYKHDFMLAAETFRHIITEFPDEPIRFNAMIWLARTHNENGALIESEKILSTLENNRELPDDLKTDLNATYADYYLKQDDYARAIPKLERAVARAREKHRKILYHFVLAQLYQRTRQWNEASDHYRKVIKLNPPYEMTFHARINLAGVYQAGSGDSQEIRNELRKMIRDEKNREYLDRIYHALGDIYLKEGRTGEAIEYYRLAAEKSTSNTRQKTLSYLALADLYYEMPEYEMAEAYYDSAVIYMEPDFPGYEDIRTQSESLTRLVKNLNEVHLQDSVQRLASLPEPELYAFIDGIIADVREKEREEMESQSLAARDLRHGRMMLSAGSRNRDSGTEGGKWYFYNEGAKSFGQPEFIMRWGKRKLEDNWRRSNKSEISFGGEEMASVDSAGAEDAAGEILSNKSREYYLRDIPRTDSMMEISHEKIQEGLLNAGTIYKNELNDRDEAVESFTELIGRYPETEYLLPAYYELYEMYRNAGNESKMNVYKNRIIREFPETQTARILEDPSYAAEINRYQDEVNRFYERTYQAYGQGRYQEVISLSEEAAEKYEGNEVLPRFEMLKVLSIGQLSDKRVFAAHLDSILLKYPGHEVAGHAREILAYINRASPVVREERQVAEAEKIYRYDPGSVHFTSMAVKSGTDFNQIRFNLINFNLDHHPRREFEVTEQALGEEYHLVTVKSFENDSLAGNYLAGVDTSSMTFHGFDEQPWARLFVISSDNNTTLLMDKDLEKYLAFYREYYLGDVETTGKTTMNKP